MKVPEFKWVFDKEKVEEQRLERIARTAALDEEQRLTYITRIADLVRESLGLDRDNMCLRSTAKRYSDKKPDEPGWYWLDHPVYSDQPVKVYRYTSQGYDHKKGTTFLMVAGPFVPTTLNSTMFRNCKWAGPIEEPEKETP